ncbi:unnamed protein product [Brassica rapa]|uniref:Uncharacterized protein n=1 Tax=Brassica campestris TaxID=3711 RepID=A0A3P5ZTQ6_BRACM|nr:unnamed protein product [Brassica rapa]VDC75770.1 unnamed protein product [Brassica rapa]
MAWKRSTVVFYYSSNDRFTTTDRSLGQEHRIKRLGLHNWIDWTSSLSTEPLLYNFELSAHWIPVL